jgi:hypothetical protein
MLNSLDAIFDEVDRVQAHIQEVAATLTTDDVASPERMQWFTDQVTWVKRYYERIEVLING